MPPDWKTELNSAYRSSVGLLEALGLPPNAEIATKSNFPVLCTRHYASKMYPVPQDPLLRQVLATTAEDSMVTGFGTDPVGDSAALVEPGMLHKYQGRLLLVSTGSCAVHCRFCFRRNYPYGQNSPHNLADRLAARLAQDASITEIILSGGDPLLLEDSALQDLFAAAPHVARIRIHTRVPLMLPARFTPELYQILARLGTRLVFVIHANHPRELDAASAAICARLRSAGVTLLNQSVLLAGINDSADVLTELSETLFAQGILPYYLHQLDRVQGAAHFEVPEHQARALLQELRIRLPGYLVPRWVREEAGEPSKTPL